MPRTSLDAYVEAKLAEAVPGGERYVDLRVDLMAEATGEIVFTGGGRWDRRRRRYDSEGATSRILRLHDGQLDAARWLAQWFAAHRERRALVTTTGKEIWSAALTGGRRSGKTNLATKWGSAYCVAVPRAIAWIVVPSFPDIPEVERELEEILPRGWAVYVGAPWYRYRFLNGSELHLKSSHDPRALKRGRCDLAIINEAQKHSEVVYSILRPAIADRGGLTLLVANPPDTPRGEWVADYVEKEAAGKVGAKVFMLDPKKNPHVVYGALEAMQHEVNDRTYRREILGEFLPREDVVFFSWSKEENVRNVPVDADVTAAFTEARLGRAFSTVVGMDFQLTPYQAAIVYRMFKDSCPTCGDVHPWIIDEVTVEQGTEDDLIDALELKGYVGDTTAVIPDASGEWQDSERTKGRGSWDILRRRRWSNLFTPDPRMKKNPLVAERVAAANDRMRTSDGRRHLFAAPTCLATIQAFRRWEQKWGKPDKRSDFAHIGDAGTYPLWRFWPRKAPPGKAEHTRVERVEAERARALKGY